MSDFDAAFVRTLAIQSWAAYSFGMLVIFLRMYARMRRLGLKGLQLDDYLMVLAALLYTVLVVSLNVIAGGGGSNLYLPEDFITFTPEQIQARIKGSKIVIISEQAMLNVIYTIKACMLVIYSRLTLGLQVSKMTNYLAIYVAIGWTSTQIAFFTACRPFKGYWAMPPPDPQYVLMLGIPLPLITRLNVPIKQKSVLFLIFSMGIFVIIAATLTKVFNLSDIWDPSYMLWYTREASVAVYVSNLPLIWPMLREWFPLLKTFAPRSRATASHGAKGDNGPSMSHKRLAEKVESQGSKDPIDNAITTTIRGHDEAAMELEESEIDIIPKAESIEHVESPLPQELPASQWDPQPHHIHMTTTVHISEEHVNYSRNHRPGNISPVRHSESPEMESVVGYSWLKD